MSQSPVLNDSEVGVLRAIYIKTGLDKELGGLDSLDEGLRELVAGALPLVGEMLKVEQRQGALADAVRDPINYPHLAAAHGFCRDLTVLGLPQELVPWMERFFASVAPEDLQGMSRQVVHVAAGTENPAKAALFRFICFEMLCLVEWVGLRFSRTRLELLGAEPGMVEALAEREVELMATQGTAYHEELSGLEDPMHIVSHAVLACLEQHVEELRDALRTVQAYTHERLEARRRLLEVTDNCAPDEAVIILNEAAEIFDEKSYGAKEVLRMHPTVFPKIGQSAYYKRRDKLFEKAADGELPRSLRTIPVKRRRQPSMADLILSRTEREDV